MSATVAANPAPVHPPRVRLAMIVAVIAFFLAGAAWALAMPVNGTYDEGEHIIRAYGVATGQIYSDHGKQDVPRSLLPPNRGCQWKEKVGASCQTPPPADRTRVEMPTGAAGYSPLYYLPVGIPMVISPTYGGIIVGRLISALMSALLLGAAVGIAVRLRNRLLMAALVLVATPMLMNLSGSINPNGLEISAGALLWCALLALVRGDPDDPLDEKVTHRLIWIGGIAAGILMTVRHMGPVLLLVSLLAALVMARPGRVRALLRRRDMWWTAGILFVLGLLAVVWILTSGVTDITAIPQNARQYGLLDTTRLILVSRFPFYLQQIVGQFSYGETTLPSWVIVGWYLPIAALVLPALLFAGRRFRLAMLGLFCACVAILVVLEFSFIHTAGWAAHSRYIMPSGIGLVLAAAFVRRWRLALGPLPTERMVQLAVLVTIPLQWWALAAVMTRFQIGPTALIDPLTGSWLPKGGPLPALTTEVIGSVTLGVLAWRLTRNSGRSVHAAKTADQDSTAVPSTH
ncbi:MAG TPA: DUF2142 domain-containing protein [Rugosimonospora sp.]|jgi:hypothetical protein